MGRCGRRIRITTARRRREDCDRRASVRRSARIEVMEMFSEEEWRRKANKEMAKLIIAEEFAVTQCEKDIIRIKKVR